VHLGNVRLERHGAFEETGRVGTAELMRHDAEPVQGGHMSGFRRADLPVELLGFGKPPGPMMIERLSELPLGLLPFFRFHR
jgi:hypothetical protein